MTMPENINITVCFADGTGEWYHTNDVPEEDSDLLDGILIRTPYVRADIVDELARALELFMMSAHDYQTGLDEGEDALARYNAATEGK